MKVITAMIKTMLTAKMELAVFPQYLYDTDVLFIASAEYRDRTEYLYMPCENEAITNAFGRLGAENPDDVKIII